ncbi:MAG: DegV family protein [Clostridia bacterium]|nr:DegV family protein [Clostridia bacterium]
MSKTVITADSPIDLSAEQAKRYGIEIIPLHVILDSKDYLDGVNITPDDIYDAFNEKDILPSTSAISVAEYQDFFKKFVDEGFSVVHLSLSSAISSTYQNACIAAMDYDNVHVVDTRRLSTGMAVLAIKGVEMALSQTPAAEIAANLTAMRDKVSTSFILETLTYMNKGGRCSSLVAFGANILGIKPTIENQPDGSLTVGKKYRGKTETVRRQYIDDKLSAPNIDYSRIFVDHSGIDEDELKELKSYIEDNYNFKEVLVSRAGSTISTHCGPGTFALMFMYN